MRSIRRRSSPQISETKGYRAAEAFVRPTPVAAHGDVISFAFDLRKTQFELSVIAPTPTDEKAPTEIFLPDYHFPRNGISVDVSSGRWQVSNDDAYAGFAQRLKWWHQKGSQTIRVKRVLQQEEEARESYLEQCKEKSCTLM